MKTCDEMMNSLLERREAYRAAQRKKKKILLSATASLCVVTLLGVTLWQSERLTPPAVTEPQPGAADTQESTSPTVTESRQETTSPTMPSYTILWDHTGEYLSGGDGDEVAVDSVDSSHYNDAYCYQYDKVCGVNLRDFLSNHEETDKIALFVRPHRYKTTLFEHKFKGKTVEEYYWDLTVASSDGGAAREAYRQACRDYRKYAAVQLKKRLEEKGFDCSYTEGAEYLIFFATEEEFASLTLGEEEDRYWKYDWATEPMPRLVKRGASFEFVYKGKTVEQYYSDSKYYYENMDRKFYTLIYEEGEMMAKGEDLYLTKDPDGNPWLDICGEPWTKAHYDANVVEYGDMLTKYIVDGEFLKDKAQADWDALLLEQQEAVKRYEEACEAARKHGNAELKKELEQLGYECTYTEDKEGIIFYITYQDYVTFPWDLGGRWVKFNEDGTIIKEDGVVYAENAAIDMIENE